MNHILSKGIVLGAVTLASMLAYPSPPSHPGQAGQHSKLSHIKTESRASLAQKSQLVSKSRAGQFLENGGQWDSRAVAHAHSPGLDYWVSKNGLVMDFNRAISSKKAHRVGHVVSMTFDGAGAATPEFAGKQLVKTDFISGGHKKTIHAGTYSEVRLKNLYPGVDMRNYFDEKRPRYDLLVHPGADASKILLNFKGQTKLSVDTSGDLVMGTSLGDKKEEGLRAYTLANGKKTPVKAAFRLVSNNKVSISLGAYDHSANLVIDPLIYGSYFGGDDGRDEVNAVTSTPDGGVYMTGWTESMFFPVITGAYQYNLSAPRTAFVTLFRGDAYTVLYNSYIGGSVSFTGNASDDEGQFVQITPDGTELWVAGITDDIDFASNGGLMASGVSYMSNVENTSMPNGWLVMFNIQTEGSPVPQYASFVGPGANATEFTLNGFVTDPLDGSLLLAGTVNGFLNTASNNVGQPPASGVNNVWLLHLSSIPSNELTAQMQQNSIGSLFYPSSQNETVTGLASDPDGDFVISGTVPSPLGSTGFNVLDLSANPEYFYTQPGPNGPWPNMQLLRGEDLYAAKINSTTFAFVWAGVIGGSQDDFAAGFNQDAGSVFSSYYDGTPLLSNSVATDSEGNVYVLGSSGSFDYPRTGGVIGEQNREDTVVVTEVATDASQYVYSTGLNTGGLAIPVGIAVDGAGNASITGLVKASMIWPSGTPPNPFKPDGDAGNGSVQVTGDGLLQTYTWYDGSSSSDIPTDKAWLNVINNTATQLLYGSYIGSPGNNTINYPFVDQFGDVWVFGETDTYFGYTVFPFLAQTEPQPYFVSVDTPMPAGFITPLAFKANPDGPYPAPEPAPGNAPAATNWLQDYTSGVFPYINPTPGNGILGTVSMWESTDGYILRFRISLPVISGVTLNPNPCPGGLGATTTGTVTLSAAAPAQGANVTITINSNLSAAQFNGSSPYTTTVTIPSGQTQGTFVIATNAVTQVTPVQVEADYEGNVLFKTLTVVPWLQQFSVTPTILPGGDNVNATVTLSAPAPAGGITATVTADVPGDISTLNPLPISITVPQGQTTQTIPITTAVVSAQSTVNLTATIAGVSQSVPVTLTPINIAVQSLSLSANTANAGGTVTGTVTLATPAPQAGVTVTVQTSSASIASLPANGGATYATTYPVQIQPNSLTGTFTVTAGTIPVGATATISIPGNTSIAPVPLTVSAVGFTESITPGSISGGGTATLTLTLSAPTTLDPLNVSFSGQDSNVTITPTTTQNFAAGGSVSTTPVTTLTYTISTAQVASEDDETIVATLTDPTLMTSETASAGIDVLGPQIASFVFGSSTVRATRTDTGYVYLQQPLTGGASVLIGFTYGPTGTTSPSLYFMQSTYTTMVTSTPTQPNNQSGPVVVTARRFTRPVSVPIQAAIGKLVNNAFVATGPAVGTQITITR